MNKKGSGTLTGIVISMLIVVGAFSGFFIFYTEQMDNYNFELDEKYNETNQIMIQASEDIENERQQLEEAIDNIEESPEGFLAAINGFKGLGTVLLSPLEFTSISFNVVTGLFFATDFIPPLYQNLLIVGITIIIILILIGWLKGEPKT